MAAENNNTNRAAQADADVKVSFAGKWQFPLLMLAVVMFMIGVISFAVSKPGFDWDKSFRALALQVERVSNGDYTEVARQARAFLHTKHTPAGDKEKFSKIYMLLGEIHWRVINESAVNTDEQWETLKSDYRNAITNGQQETALIANRLATAYLGLGDASAAVRKYRNAIDLDPENELDYRRKIIYIRRELLKVPTEELMEDYIQCLDLPKIKPDEYGWAIDQAVSMQLRQGHMETASKLIQRQQSHLPTGEVANHLLYQRARVLAARGLNEQADDLLISLADQLVDNSDLYLKVKLLRADQIWEENPSEAEKLFREVIDRGASLPLAPAAMVGLGRTLANRGLYEQALNEFDNAIEKLKSTSDGGWLDPDMLADSITNVYDKLMEEDRSALALRFALSQKKLNQLLQATLSPTKQMHTARRIVVARIAESDKSRKEYEAALNEKASAEYLKILLQRWRDRSEADGNDLMELADLASSLNEKIYGESLYQAANSFIRANKWDKAAESLEEFISSRPDDNRTPEARYLLGVMFQRMGHYDDAISAFKTNIGGETLDDMHAKAVEGLVPMAMCYVAKGPEHFEDAEKILSAITNDLEGLTPESDLYKRALFALGDLYYRQDKWRQARIALDEAVKRDPGRALPDNQPDPDQQRPRFIRSIRASYVIADSYLRSARRDLLESSKADVLKRQDTLRRARAQLGEASRLYALVVDKYDSLVGELEDIDRLILRNSCFSQADCAFEMGDYQKAINLYEAAVRRNRRSREALGGLTNIYNCYMELGQPEQANAAIERAARLRKVIEPEKDVFIDPQLAAEQWDRWLESVEFLNPAQVGQEAS